MQLEEWEQRLGAWALPIPEELGRASNEPGQLSVASSSSRAEEPPPAWLESIEQSAMACEFEVLLNQGQYPQGMEIARDALRVVHRLEDELSVYRPNSDFSTVNRVAHLRPVAVRWDVRQILQIAKDVSRETGRAFDVTAGKLSDTWGFSRRQGRRPDQHEIEAALECVNSDWIEVDEAAGTVRLQREGVRLNPGGIGKGYALDKVADGLVTGRLEDFLVHGGRSSVLARGNRRGTQGWWVALAHPLRWEDKLGRVRLRHQALGTSGAGKQYFHYQGVRYSHVIDPRSGWPAQSVLSATAICRSAALADALATAFMVMGSQLTQQFCEHHPSVSAILVSAQPQSSRLVVERINLPEEHWDTMRVDG